MEDLLNSLKHEVASRKFRAFIAAELGVLLAYLKGEIEPEAALTSAVVLVIGYLITVALEDSAEKVGQGAAVRERLDRYVTQAGE